MSEWIYRLNLSDIYHSDVLSLSDKARIIANRIERAPFFEKAWTFSLSDVVDQFRDLASDKRDDVEEFDEIMHGLYDYADAARVWVITR